MFYNPSVLKAIGWEYKPIYLRFGIPYFKLQIDILCSLIPQFRGNLMGEKCTCLLLGRIKFVYNIVRLTLISNAF